MKKVLVTGHRGYIGAHLIALLKEKNISTTGCDLGLFSGCEWEVPVEPDICWTCDFRSLTLKHLQQFDTIMHLAAISNDPMGDLDPSITREINLQGTIDLANKAKQAGVSRFLNAGSCSVYGRGDNLDLREGDPLSPLTIYAESKIEAEKALLLLHDETFCVTSLRNATAYGHSPMLRIDLVVNNFLGCALARGEILVKSDGSPWRPLIHCKDIARAFIAFAEAPKEVVGGKAVNVGANSENYQVREILNKVMKIVPDAKVVYTGEVGNDPRNYRVCFDLLRQLLPDFRLEYDLDQGIEELFHKFQEHHFSAEDFEGDRYTRLKRLKKRLHLIVEAASV